MNFFRELTRKPWLASDGEIVDLHDGSAFALPKVTLGLRVFLVVASVVFTLFFVAYLERMTLDDWRPMSEPWLLWLSTGLLILSSVGLQWARVGARRGRLDVVKKGMAIGGVFALGFLVNQLVVWQHLVGLGYFVAENPANAFFYLLTGAHGLHLLGGLIALGRTGNKVWGVHEVSTVRLSVDLCTVYWHFLLAIWFVLFALLLIT